MDKRREMLMLEREGILERIKRLEDELRNKKRNRNSTLHDALNMPKIEITPKGWDWVLCALGFKKKEILGMLDFEERLLEEKIVENRKFLKYLESFNEVKGIVMGENLGIL